MTTTSKEKNQTLNPVAASPKTGKIYCANCIHCKLVRSFTDYDSYVLRVRCASGKWKKKQGGEKFYKYFTVMHRALDECDAYNPMGDSKTFMRELRKNLPIKDETYIV